MNSKTQTGALDALHGFLHELRGPEIKVAETGDPSPSTGAPIKEVDNGTRKPVHGERYSENTSDVRKSLGSAGVTGQEDANSVGDKSEKGVGELKRYTADEKAPQSIKDNPMKPKDGPGPGDSTYSDRKFASFAERLKAARTKIASDATTETPAASENHVDKSNITIPAAKKPSPAELAKQAELEKTAAEEKRAAAEEHKDVAALGYELAQTIALEFGAGLQKAAASDEEQKRETAQIKIANIQAAAAADAQLFVEVMQGFAYGQQKKAEGDPAAAGGGMQIPPEAMAAMSGGGEGGGAPEGAAPGAEGGGDPAAGGGGGGNEKLEALAHAMEQLGIEPEDLAHAIAQIEQQDGGGGGGGAEGGGEAGGGMPPGMPQ